MTPSARSPRLSINNLQCSAGNRVLFEGLSLELFDGQCLLLKGPNGSGKTTLLRTLAGLTRPTQGTFAWAADGRRLYQGHNSGWKLELSAIENLSLQIALDEIDADQYAILAALERASIAQQAQLAFGRLSAGQRRRLSLARMMLDSRPIWLLDEPSTALDEQGLDLLGELLDQKLANHGVVVAATHQDLHIQRAAVSLDLSSLDLSSLGLSSVGLSSRGHIGLPSRMKSSRE